MELEIANAKLGNEKTHFF